MSLSDLLFSLLYTLSLGTFVTFGFIRSKHVGRRYYIYHGLGATLLTLGAFLLLNRSGLEETSNLYLFAFVFFGTLYPFLIGGVLEYLSYLLATIAGFAFLWTTFPPEILSADLLLSTLLLGTTLGAMLLGHWYLIEPKLPIEELKRLTLAYLAALALRWILALGMGWDLLSGKSELELSRYLVGHPGIFVMMRIGWGLVVPTGLGYLIYRTTWMRSTQSATGILYVAVVCVLVGEILSQYLALFHGIFF